MSEYEQWQARQAAVVAAVACPRCKAPAGTGCTWGVTHSSGAVHTDRSRAFDKLPKAVQVERAPGPECQCGCGEHTKGGRFRPGHDARFHAAQKRAGQPAGPARKRGDERWPDRFRRVDDGTDHVPVTTVLTPRCLECGKVIAKAAWTVPFHVVNG